MYITIYFQSNIFNKFSVGVLYLAIESLPRNIHFKRQNILVVGIVPGPNEPSGDINTYLEPLICDMEKLWEGVTIKVVFVKTKKQKLISDDTLEDNILNTAVKCFLHCNTTCTIYGLLFHHSHYLKC